MTYARSSDGAHTLAADYYNSPEIYQRETERIFGQRWLYLDRVARLSKAGEYFLAEVDGESLIVLRDREGDIRAFFNVCRHRGTRLCSKASGELSKYIVCPYHAWAYDWQGKLAAAPHMNEVEGFEAAALSLHPVKTAIWEGLIFINLDPQAPPFEEALSPLIGKFKAYGLPDLVSVHQTQYTVQANWKLIFQNYSECYHCPSLHAVLNKLTPYRDSSNDLEEGPVLGGPMQLARGMQSMTMQGQACAAPLLKQSTQLERQLVHYYVIFPSMFLSVMPDYALVHRIRREEPGVTSVICDWLFHPEAAAQSEFDPSPAIDFWDLTNREDWRICQESQKGINSRAYRPGPYSELESMIAAFDREYLSALAS